MAKNAIRTIINSEYESAYQSGIMACLVWHCKIDSAEANKFTKSIAEMPIVQRALPEKQKAARDRIMGAMLAAVVDEQRQEGLDL